MTKQEWTVTCRRIQSRLENLKVDNMDVMGTGVRRKAGTGKQSSVDLAQSDEIVRLLASRTDIRLELLRYSLQHTRDWAI